MKLPPIPHPHRYVGLYVYDFGARVSVGYTAGEIRVLRESNKHRGGTAYEIYRACAGGALELRGVLDWRLTAREAMCFLRADQAVARTDYELLCRASERDPVPCAVEMQLARLDAFELPHVTTLSYAAAATTALAAWLAQHADEVGDQVVCGIDVHATWANSDGVRIVSCRLPALLDYSDRPAEEVLRSVHDPLQR
jgi:hypothetical protein